MLITKKIWNVAKTNDKICEWRRHWKSGHAHISQKIILKEKRTSSKLSIKILTVELLECICNKSNRNII